MREGWEIKKLSEVCEVQRGLTYSRNDTVDFSKNIVLRATNIDLESSSLDLSELKYLRDDFEIREKYKLKAGSLLICFSSGSKSHLGKVALINKNYECAFGGFIGQINPDKEIVSKYLFYNLISYRYKKYISALTDGLNINNLKTKDLGAFPIPTPPLTEQQQIVAILDKTFGLIDQAKANIEKNIENAKELFQSKLNDIFSQKGDGWEEKRFNDVCILQRGFDLPKRLRKQGEHPLVSSSGIIDTHIEAKVKAPGVVTGRSGSIGNLFFIEDDFWPLNTTLYIKDFKGNFEEYVYYFIKQFDLKRFSSGAGVPTLNRNFVHDEIVFSTNDIETQKQIVNQLNDLKSETEAIEYHYQQKLTNLEDLKKSILQKAFAGELTNKEVVV